MQPFSYTPGHFISGNQIFQLRKMLTILLLANFLVFQYARQVTYWECRFFNYLKTENKKCDCEKISKLIAGQTKSFPVPALHNHFHLDESFYPSFSIHDMGYNQASHFTSRDPRQKSACKRGAGRLDRPPQLV
jgi:hypothetical protein